MSTKPGGRITNPRGVSYGGRSAAEKRTYVEKMVEGTGPTSTAPTPLEQPGASTASPLPQNDDLLERRPSPSRGGKKKRRGGASTMEAWEKVLLAVVSGAIVSGFGYVVYNSREVGGLQESLKGVTRELDQLQKRIAQNEERVERQSSHFSNILESVRNRIDELRRKSPAAAPGKDR